MTSERAIVLYGSVARGDDDEWSDVDVLVVGPSSHLPEELRSGLKPNLPLRVSHYTWTEFTAMRATGSLFLHHLATEAKPLCFEGRGRGRYEGLLRDLPPYRHIARDIRGFRLGVGDARRGLAVGSPHEFEMSVLGGIVRHASVLACYMAGTPLFSRQSVRQACTLLGIPQFADPLVVAHRYRLSVQRQRAMPRGIGRTEADATANACDHLLDAMEAYGDAHAN